MRPPGKAVARLWRYLRRAAAAVLPLLGAAGIAAGAAGAASAAPPPAVAPHAAVEAMEERYFHRSWRRADGLPGNSVYAIAQTADGYLWLGTENGLARFDGKYFLALTGADAAAFRSRFVAALLAARDGTLWIGTERGLLALHGGVVRRDGTAGSPLGEAPVTALAQDAGGDLWVGTRSGLLRRSARSGEVTEAELAGFRITRLLAGGPDELWVGTEAHGAWHLQAGRLSRVGGDPLDPSLQEPPVTGLVRGPGSQALIFTAHPADRAAGPPGDGLAAGLPDDVTAATGNAGDLWLDSSRRGLLRVVGGRRWVAGPESVLGKLLVTGIYVAPDGIVWLASAGDGLHQLIDKSCATYTQRDGLASERTESVLVEDGTTWVGTSDGLTRLHRLPDGSFAAASELRGSEVTAVWRDRAGTLWAGSAGGGVLRLGPGGWQRLTVWGGKGTLTVESLYQDSAGRLWVTTAGGLGRLDPGTGMVAAVPRLAGVEVTSIAEAEDGSLWLGTRGAGLLRLPRGASSSSSSPETLLPASQLPIITGVWRGQGGEMWVGTFGNGLLHHTSGPQGRWTVLDEAAGLPDNTVRQLALGRGGDLWTCTGAGISRLARPSIAAFEAGRVPTLTALGYGPQDGVAEGVCYGFAHPGAMGDGAGHLWFATAHGLVEVRPERFLARRGRPPVPRLDAVSIDGRDWTAVARAAALRIPAGTRRVTFEWSAPIFLARDRMAMRYRLAGFDADWTSAQHAARYTSLPPGAYRFEVELRDASGTWRDPAVLASLDVQPPFYLSDTFPFVAGFALAALIGLAQHLAKRRLLRRAAQLERLVEERTEALSEANRQLEALARVDPLTGLANRRHWQETLEREVRRNARSSTALSLVLLDVDFFKGYNDTLGHPAGDLCLARVAAAVRGVATRAGDLAARYGGEEFGILLPATSALQALGIAESLRQAVERLDLPHPTSRVAPHVTVSVGVASVPGDLSAAADPANGTLAVDPIRLVAEADEALYLAKHGGRNQVRMGPATARAVMAAGAQPTAAADGRPSLSSAA